MTAHVPARRGWRVMPHAVERFVERVAAVHHDEAAAWLADHAHEAVRLGVRSRRGDPLYRLRHPFPGPDAVLVVKIGPGGIRAVVTCGWWDEDDPDDTPDSAPLTTPPAPVETPERVLHLVPRLVPREDAASAPPPAPVAPPPPSPRTAPPVCPPPTGLPCPPGPLSLGALWPGMTLDTDALTHADLVAWTAYIRQAKEILANGGSPTTTALAKRLEITLRAAAHRRLLADQKAAKRKRLATPPDLVAKAINKGDHLRAILTALGDVLRGRYGQSATDDVFAEARHRVDALRAQPKETP